MGETYILMDVLAGELGVSPQAVYAASSRVERSGGFSYFFLRPNNIMPAIKEAITPMISSLDKLP